jgi:hypothetical protein
MAQARASVACRAAHSLDSRNIVNIRRARHARHASLSDATLIGKTLTVSPFVLKPCAIC